MIDYPVTLAGVKKMFAFHSRCLNGGILNFFSGCHEIKINKNLFVIVKRLRLVFLVE